ncbi:MAG: cbb3-type cytochrome oxidase assembly protein [Coraliomargaritaceae bacterium]
MSVENYLSLLPLLLLAIFFFGVAISMFYWSAKKGQLKNFDQQARVIFTEEEPEGEISDHFPSEKHTSHKTN